MRDRIVRYAFILLLALLVSGLGAGLPQVRAPNPTGYLEEVQGVRIVHVYGSAYELGLQQGALLREPLRDLVASYLHEHFLLERNASHFDLLTWAQLLERQMPASWRREMQGIADGAGLSYQDVLLLNTVPDLWMLTDGLLSGAAFAVWGHATQGGELMVGHNLQCAEADSLWPYLTVVVRHPAQGNAFVSVGLMGMVGIWAGMNEEKMTASLLPSPSVDITSTGYPLPFLLREVLERAGDLADALDIVLASERLAGGNLLLGDGKAPEAVAVELSAHRHVIFEDNLSDGALARTGHFLDPDLALAQQDVLSVQERALSEARLRRLQTLLEFNRGWIGIEKGLAFLQDAPGAESGGKSGSEGAIHGSHVLHSVLFCPGRLTLWLARHDATALQAPYVHLDLTSLLLGRY